MSTAIKDAIYSRLEEVLETIELSAERSGRKSDDVRLVAATKTRSPQELLWYQECIQSFNRPCIFGENYVQEFRSKSHDLEGSYRSHLIGRLQSNKSREAVELFDVIESVDSLKLAQHLQREAAKLGKRQVIFLQVNISHDGAKGGFEPDVLTSGLMEELVQLSMLEISGLMTITQYYDNPEEARGDFRAMRLLRERLLTDHARCFAGEVCHLSMGMSADYGAAIEEGATIVRIGSSLFGSRIA
jgi:PLP dependent protein